MANVKKRIVLAALIFCWVHTNAQTSVPFGTIELEKSAALHPKIADIDGDGINDIIIVCDYADPAVKPKQRIKNICWLKGPDYKRQLIATLNYRSCGMAVRDVNKDGKVDVIGLEDPDGIDGNENGKLFVYLNEDNGAKWKRQEIGLTSYAKDIETGDLNNDGLMDVAVRTVNNQLQLFIQTASGWEKKVIETPAFDGLAISDLDGDGDLDIVINGMWLENKKGEWVKHDYDKARYTQKTGKEGHWADNNTRLAAGDINQDGNPDIIITQSERYGLPLSWYENPGNPAKDKKWKEHIISKQDHLHTLSLNDVNGDGTLDIISGRLILDTDTLGIQHPVTVFYNYDKGNRWEEQILSEEGIYGGASGDLDNDGDIDIVGPRNFERGPVIIYKSTLKDPVRSLTSWKYINIDDKRGKWGDTDKPDWLRYFGLDAADATGDGFLDLVSGRYFYKNPGGDMTGKWERTDLGMNVDAVMFVDVDGDENIDCIAEAFPDVYWMEATDKTCTKWIPHLIAKVTETKHVNGQGFALAQIIKGGKPEIVLGTGAGIVCIEIPTNPEKGNWPVHTIAPEALDEGIAVGDLDGDGDLDISSSMRVPPDNFGKGVIWWENPGSISKAWIKHTIGETPGWADRFKIADVNGDGKQDVIVSEERYPGLEPDASLFWFENKGKGDKWEVHKVITQYSMNNLDAADLDGDGDIDIVTNEHKGGHQTQVLENDGHGNFKVHQIDVGHESHLGTKLFDLDNDGDLDMVSIAWDNWVNLHLWRNDANNKVTITDDAVDEGAASYKIITPFATFYLQKDNGGFSSIIDKNGSDWINFTNSSEPDGPALAGSAYRGMPNLNNRCTFKGVGHPGFKSCYTKQLNDSTIYVISTNGEYEYTWTFTAKTAYLTMLKAGATCPYWFLYEGTPAGKFDPENQFWGTDVGFSTNKPDLLKGTALQKNFDWIYFGDRDSKTVMALAQLIPDDKMEMMSYMGNTKDGILSQDGMVVFGFGRLGSDPQLKTNNVFMMTFLNLKENPSPATHAKLKDSIEILSSSLKKQLNLADQ